MAARYQPTTRFLATPPLARASLALLLAIALALQAAVPASAGQGEWTRIGPADLIVGPVAADPSNPDVLLAGIASDARRADGSVTRRTDDGLARSLDRGNTWTLVSPETKGRSVGFVEFDPKDSRIVYASIDPCAEDCVGDKSPFLLRSADGGTTWSVVYRGSVNDIAIYQSDPTIVYISTGDIPSSKGAMLRAASASLESKSQTRGDDAARTALSPGLDLIETSLGRPAREAAPAGSAPSTPQAGQTALAKSVDRGLTWTSLAFPYADFTFAIAVDPRNPNLILASNPGGGEAGGGDTYRSGDGGKTWRQLASDLGVPRGELPGPFQLTFDGSGSAVYAFGRLGCGGSACTQGVLRSIDGGKTWRAALASTSRNYGAVVSSRSRPNEVFVVESFFKANGWSVNRVLHATSPRGSFSQVGSPIENAVVWGLAVDQASPQTFYVRTNGGLYAYTLPASAGGLPATGGPPVEVLPSLAAIGAALALVGLRLRRQARPLAR